jgi:hypothetical protein
MTRFEVPLPVAGAVPVALLPVVEVSTKNFVRSG